MNFGLGTWKSRLLHLSHRVQKKVVAVKLHHVVVVENEIVRRARDRTRNRSLRVRVFFPRPLRTTFT